jgi:TonB family protein
MRATATLAAVLTGLVGLGAAAQRGPAPGCEPAAPAPMRPVPDLLVAARCYDEQWRFADAERLLGAALTPLTTEAASAAPAAAAGGARFVDEEVARPPQVNAVDLEYPSAALKQGVKGQVVVEVTVGTDGRVRQASVVESIPLLDKAALDAARKLRFAPTLLGGEPIEVSFFAPVRFDLASESTPADWIDLALAYYKHGRPSAAVPLVGMARDRERKDLARFGPVSRTAGDLTGGAQVGPDVQAPRKLHDVTPSYPAYARKARLGGTVVIDALIDRAGLVGRSTVLRSAPGLDGPALDAVSQWVYAPAIVKGEPVTVNLVVTVRFAVR